MKILHSADWHLDAPLVGRTPEQAALLRRELLALPGKVAAAAKAQNCDMMLLSGDLFDGAYTPESVHALKNALEEVAIPVFIAPGNHDYVSPVSPWTVESWPKNVHIFTTPDITWQDVPELDCRVYGAAFTAMDMPSLLEGFRAQTEKRFAIGVFHGDPTQVNSPYSPITSAQVQNSNLSYLALGHIHKGGDFRVGSTLCAWPGCPMGRGFDELGEKGVRIVTLEDTVHTQFLPLDTPRFFDLETDIRDSAEKTLQALLPPVANNDFYRITFTGESEELDLPALQAQFSQFPNLELRDQTLPPLDIWGTAGQDSLEGVYFGMLHNAMADADEADAKRILLAAKISRQILSGQEVSLP